MKQFSDETLKIIKAHKKDFNCTNFTTKLKSYGGYGSYLDKLGGVFRKWNGKTAHVRTVSEFHEIAEYVIGLMSIWGFDYNNGKTYHRWSGGSPFYVNGRKGRCNWGRIDDLCSSGSKSKTTNCNFGVDALLFKAGLFGQSGQPSNSCAFKSMIKTRHMPFFRDIKDLKVGDLIQFFHSKVTSNNPNNWKQWGHVAIVSDVTDDGRVFLYDFGGRFITSGNPKHEMKVNSKGVLIGPYSGWEGWVAVRCFDLVDDTKSASDLAVAVIHGDYGSGETRKEKLGKSYDLVQTLVNSFLQDRDVYLTACAMFVVAGHAGSGEKRKKYFGSDYDEVQSQVNLILKQKTTTQIALEVIDGKWGSGKDRIDALKKAGYDPQMIQTKVNLILS